MRNLIAVPVIILAVILQSSVVSEITLLSGYGDLPLVMIAAWSLQERVDTAWLWAITTGLLVGFVSGVNWVAPVVGYVVVVALVRVFQMRLWQVPLFAMFSITFLGTLVVDALIYLTILLAGVSIPFQDAFVLQTLPGVLLNLLMAVPVYAVMRDLAQWAYPAMEAE